MCNQKGFSLIEIMIVLVFISLILLLSIGVIIGRIDQARANTLLNEARMVNYAGQAVILEISVAYVDVSDDDYMAGLSGTVDKGALAIQTRMSQRMKDLIGTDLILSDEVTTGKSKVSFKVENTKIVSMTYEAMVGNRHFAVTIANGETTVERIK